MAKNEILRKSVIEGIQNYETQVSIARKNDCTKQNINRLVKTLFKKETLLKIKKEKKELTKKREEINKI